MAESIARTFSPFAYTVENVSTLNKELVEAYRSQNDYRIKKLLKKGHRSTVDVFITINKYLHACIVIIPVSRPEFKEFGSKSEGAFDGLDNTTCWRFELCFENIQSKKYQITMKKNKLQEFKEYVKRTYFIARYELNDNDLCLQLAVLRAAPKYYNTVFADCVEFAKNFCVELLEHCSNQKTIDATVRENIKKATATGFSVEYISRNFASSGLLGSSVAGGPDVSSFLLGNRLFWVAVCYFVIYPVIGLLFVLYIYENYISIQAFSSG